MKPHWRWFFYGMAAATGLLILALIFAAYQMPGLFFDWAGLAYCG